MNATTVVVSAALLLSSPVLAQNGVGPGGFSLEVIAFENCPGGDFTDSNRRMIAVQANYQFVDGDLASNQHHKLVNELVRNNTIKLTPGPDFQVLEDISGDVQVSSTPSGIEQVAQWSGSDGSSASPV